MTPTAVARDRTPLSVLGNPNATPRTGAGSGATGRATPPSGVVGGAQTGAQRSGSDAFPVAGHGPQHDRSGRPEQLATALVLAGAVMLVIGMRSKDRQRT
jgi:hypothetical protein